MSARLHRRVYDVLESAEADDLPSRAVDSVLMLLILANVAAVMLETVGPAAAAYGPWFSAFEAVSVAVFTVEYLTRLWSVTADPRYRGAVSGRLRWAATPLALVDLFAVLPFFLPFVGLDLRFLRALRLLRFARLFKVGRYSAALGVLVRVLKRQADVLLSALVAAALVLVVMASLLYIAERDAQPDVYSSIPITLWWSITILTGNSQTPPVTLAGRVIGALTSLLGVGLFALPAGILASGFSEEIRSRTEEAGKSGEGPL